MSDNIDNTQTADPLDVDAIDQVDAEVSPHEDEEFTEAESAENRVIHSRVKEESAENQIIPSTRGSKRSGSEAASDEDDLPDNEEVSSEEVSSEEACVEGQVPEPSSIVEALLFSTESPLSAGKISLILGIGTAGDVKKIIEDLNKQYEEAGCSFRIQAIAGGFQMFTLPEFNPWLAKLSRARAESRLSQAALETLAIVAYKQPVLRADIEAVRGVAVGDMLGRLRELKLVKIAGRAEEIGRPLLYGTTARFLEIFGLASLKDLPKLDQVASGSGVPKLKVPTPSEEVAESGEVSSDNGGDGKEADASPKASEGTDIEADASSGSEED